MVLIRKLRLFEVYADYRKNNDHRYPYYVVAVSVKEARQKFQSCISWLEIISIREVEDELLQREVIDNPYKFICIDRNLINDNE